jgi:lipopolysaccharide export system protein LptC
MRDPGGVSFAGGNDRARVFRTAARHSRHVRFFRRAIPVTLVGVLVAIAAGAFFQPLRLLAKLPIDPRHLVLSGSKINMEAPRIGGFTRDGRPYDLTARSAAQDLTNPGVLELTDILAHVTMQDHSTLELSAANGVYDTKADLMDLKTNVVIITSTGYTVHMDEANVDNKAGRVMSNRPVSVKMTTDTVDANGLEVVDNGDLIRFTGGVETHLVPQQGPGSANAAAAANPAPATRR